MAVAVAQQRPGGRKRHSKDGTQSVARCLASSSTPPGLAETTSGVQLELALSHFVLTLHYCHYQHDSDKKKTKKSLPGCINGFNMLAQSPESFNSAVRGRRTGLISLYKMSTTFTYATWRGELPI